MIYMKKFWILFLVELKILMMPRKSLKELLEETPDFMGKEIWNDGYFDGLKDSDQIRMRDALERLLECCETYLDEDQPVMPVRYVERIVRIGLGMADETN